MKTTRSLLLGLLAALLSFPAAAQMPGNEIRIYPGSEAGELIFDAADLSPYLPTPEDPRQFADLNELHDFMVGELNALPITDDSTGQLLGFEGLLNIIDEPCVDYGSGKCEPVESPFAAYLGGETGFFFVGDEEFCVDETKCDPRPLSTATLMSLPPAEVVTASASNDEFVIAGTSFAKGFHYREVGTTTRQISGGYKRWEEMCEWWVLFWYCWDVRGKNTLTTETFYFDKQGEFVYRPKPISCNNCNSVRQVRWGLWFGTGWPEKAPWKYRGVFGRHFGDGTGGSMFTMSCTETGC